jgi:hypothetical protein
MSMTNASATVGAVRRSEVAHPSDDPARGRSPYQASTVTGSYDGVFRQIAESIRNRQISSGEPLPTERGLSSAFGVSRGGRGEFGVADNAFHAAAGRAMADHIVYTANAVGRNIPSSITGAMASHSSNAGAA